VLDTLVLNVVAGGAVEVGLTDEEEDPLPPIWAPGFLSVRRPGRYGRSL